jgi:hypothetical protein
MAQSRVPKARSQAAVLPMRALALKQKSKPFAVRQLVEVIALGEFDKGFGHAMQAKRGQIV